MYHYYYYSLRCREISPIVSGCRIHFYGYGSTVELWTWIYCRIMDMDLLYNYGHGSNILVQDPGCSRYRVYSAWEYHGPSWYKNRCSSTCRVVNVFAVYKRKLEGGEKTLVTVTSYGVILFMTTNWNRDNDSSIKMTMLVRTT